MAIKRFTLYAGTALAIAIAVLLVVNRDGEKVSAYAPTEHGTEVQAGSQVPPALSSAHDTDNRILQYRFGTSDVAPFGTSFEIPLDDASLDHLKSITTTSGPVALRVAELPDITMIIVYNDGIDVEYRTGADVDELRLEIENIIAEFG